MTEFQVDILKWLGVYTILVVFTTIVGLMGAWSIFAVGVFLSFLVPFLIIALGNVIICLEDYKKMDENGELD